MSHQNNMNLNKSTFKSEFNKSHLNINPNINFIDNYGQTDRDNN